MEANLDLRPALDSLPLFPLQEVVLFPGAVLPLHVFEPRYKAMIRDCLASHRALAVVQITDSDNLDEHGHPGIARIAGAGVIIDHAELPEGRFNILVQGRERVRLEELPFVAPYRTARATIVPTAESGCSERDFSALVSNAAAFVTLVRDRDSRFDFRLPKDAPPGVVADICAHHLVVEASERQAILETLDLQARVLRVTEALALQRLALGKKDRDLN